MTTWEGLELGQESQQWGVSAAGIAPSPEGDSGLGSRQADSCLHLAGKCPGLRWHCWDLGVSGAAAPAPGAVAAVTLP